MFICTSIIDDIFLLTPIDGLSYPRPSRYDGMTSTGSTGIMQSFSTSSIVGIQYKYASV